VIVFRCANGVVLMRTRFNKKDDTLDVLCLNDGSVIKIVRTNQGFEAGLQSMAAKASGLRGAIQQLVDLPEIGR
jgi:hypothetical protein